MRHDSQTHLGRAVLLSVLTICSTLAFVGCTGSTDGDDGATSGSTTASSSTASSSPTSSPEPLESRLLSVDQLPGDGWVAAPPPTPADPGGEAPSDPGLVCQGDFRSILGALDDDVTARFERGDVSFTEQLIPSDDPSGVVDDLEAAVSACFGVATPMSTQDATAAFDPLPESAKTESSFGAVTRITTSSSVLSVPFLATAGDGVVIFTQSSAGQGAPSIDLDEFIRLSELAATSS